MFSVQTKRYFAKIRAGKTQASAEVVYFRNDMEFQFLMRWIWYFRYRAALLQVQNPKWFVEFRTGDYDYVPPREQQLKTLKDKIAGKKAVVTKTQKAITLARFNWNSLFPIEDDRDFQRANVKLAEAKTEVTRLEKELFDLITKRA